MSEPTPDNTLSSGQGLDNRFGLWKWAFVGFMLALTGLFVILGTWQMNRLEEKLALISAIEGRSTLPEVSIPSADEWAVLNPEDVSYLPLVARGTFDHEQTVRVFTSLANPNGRFGGAGYWIITPLITEQGTVLVNRGFVPQDMSDQFVRGGGTPQGEVEIRGLGRIDESVNTFTPLPDFTKRIDWVRNVERVAAFIDPKPERLAPFMIDQQASETGALPQGGETRLQLSNRHLDYALTWYGLAIVTPLLLGVWVWRQRKGANA